jgi:hypothetical protein
MVRDPQLLTRLARLAAEVAIDAQALTTRCEETRTLLVRWRKHGTLGRADLMLVAINLHGYYTGLETLCERIARQLDETVPSGPTWHAELLTQMQVEVPGLRPRVIDPAVVGDLHELRKFRHFFRNAYVLDFDPALVKGHAERVDRVHGATAASIATFRDHLEQTVQALGRSD